MVGLEDLYLVEYCSQAVRRQIPGFIDTKSAATTTIPTFRKSPPEH
jgi:hypothetical protein